jgi:hypothetical protein
MHGILPIFVADTICDDDIRKFVHHSRSRRIHEVQSTAIIGFLKGIFV